MIDPVGGYVRNAEHGEGWMIDGLSEDMIRRIGKRLRTMAKDNRESLIRKLLKELPELLADYEHLAPDSDG
jgi:hypothetical protein